MKSFHSLKQLPVVILLGVLFSSSQSYAVVNIDVRQAQSMSQQGTLLLDVREPSEYAEEHAPNATLIPLGQLGARINELASYKNKPIVVMCHSGRRSAIASQLLEQAGYTQVDNVSGGIMAWEKAGLKVIRKQ
jgi:rhodanese-related sulfurtransferase